MPDTQPAAAAIPWLPPVQESLPTVEATSTDPVAFLLRVHRNITDPEAGVGLCHIPPKPKEGEAPPSKKQKKNGINEYGTVSLAGFGKQDVLQHLTTDVYWNINTLWLPPDCTRTRKSHTTGLPITKRKKKHFRYLNAAYVDIDAYKAGIDPEAAYDRALSHLRDYRLPLPTLSLWSGQGVWLFWELAETVEAKYENRDRLERINKTIREHLSFLGSDPNPIDCSRICRIPGSFNSKTGKRVKWRTVPGSERLTITELFVGFDCIPLKTGFARNEEQAEKDGRQKDESRRLRAYRRWETRCEDISKLVDYQNQTEGLRYPTIFWYAALAKRAGQDYEHIMVEASRIGLSRSTPPLEPSEIERAVKNGMSKKLRLHISDAAIIRKLDIPESVGQLLGLRMFRKRKRTHKARGRKREAIRQAILTLIDEAGKVIPTRKMAKLLRPRFSLSHVAVSKHYAALDLTRKRTVNKSPCVSSAGQDLHGEKLTRGPKKQPQAVRVLKRERSESGGEGAAAPPGGPGVGVALSQSLPRSRGKCQQRERV